MADEYDKASGLADLLPTLIPVLVLVMMLLPIIISRLVLDNERSRCNGQNGAPVVRIVSSHARITYIYAMVLFYNSIRHESHPSPY